ncbi:MAG: hypothetical protein KAJ64_01760 [Thermoplasmata archaeon]|nr:hypothetical protein [Thermoplasmata archaeon]
MGLLKEKIQAAKGKPVLVASGILTAIFNTIALLLIAREMGAELLGVLGFLLSFVGLLYFAGDMGNGLAFEKLLANGYKFKDCFRVFTIIKIKLTIQLAIASGLLIALYSYVLAPEGHTAIHPISMFIILGYFIMANLAQIWVVGLSVKGREMQAKSYDLIEGLVKVVLVGGIILLAIPGGDQEAIFQLTLIYLLAGTMGMMIIRNNARRLKKGESDDEIILEFHETSRKLMPFIAFTGLVLTLDKVLLWFFTEPADAFETLGIYFGAQRITIFIAASAVSIQSLLGGALGQYIESDDTRSISATLRMTERYVSLVVLPVATFYVIFSGDLLNAFLGEEFAGAGIAVSILAGAGFFTAMASPHIAYLLKASKTREMIAVSGLAFTVMVIGLFLLLPSLILPDMDIHGINGVSISILLSSAFGYMAARFFTWKLLDCKLHMGIFRHLFCAGQMIVVINFLIWYFNIIMELKWILLFALIATFVYGLGLYLSGEMLKDEFTEFKDLTNSD